MNKQLPRIIARALETRKRVVVPQLGAFIVKVPGQEVLFSEMLKRDDGVLRELLREEGMGELEAAGAVDRFVFELRHAVESDQVYQAEGLGLFAAGPNGTIAFRYLPVLPEPVAEPLPATESEAQAQALKAAEAAAPVPEPAPEAAAPAAEVAEEPQAPAEAQPLRPAAKPAAEAGPSRPRTIDPSVKGLRYGQTIKNTDAYTYVNSGAPRRRPDTFILLALAAVALAAGALLYGYLSDRRKEAWDQAQNEELFEAGTMLPEQE